MNPISIFDAHCDTIYRCVEDSSAHFAAAGGHWDLDQMTTLGNVAQFFAFFWDSAAANHTPAENLDRYYAVFQREISLHSEHIVLCRTADDAERAFAAGKRAAFLSVEGGELLDCDLTLLHKAYDMGVRGVNLTWNHANALSGSCVEETERGLSPKGVAFLQEMQGLGMLADVSHLSEAGFWDVIEHAQKPIMASHSNSKTAFFHPRNLTDAQFTAIIDNHGVVGLNAYSGFISEAPATQQGLLRHLEHFLSLGGQQTVALGGDWDGCESIPQGWSGVWNWSDFYELLLRENYPETLVQDLFFNNLMRTVRRVCTM